MVCCSKRNVAIRTIDSGSASSSFGARFVEKENKTGWFEHRLVIDLEYCDAACNKAKSIANMAESRMQNHDPSTSAYHPISKDVRVNGAKAQIDLKVKSGAHMGLAKRATDGMLRRLLKKDTNLRKASFDLQTEKKQRVVTFNAWDGVDRFE